MARTRKEDIVQLSIEDLKLKVKDDVELLRGIKGLLYDEGYTIRGVQRLLKEHGNRIAIEFGRSGNLDLDVEGPAGGETAPVLVGELQQAEKASQGASGLLSRIASRAGGRAEPTVSAAGVSESDIKVLQGTLQELLECKRLLDQTRQN